MNWNLKTLLLILIVMLAAISSYSQTTLTLTAQDSANIQQFQTLQGQDRVSSFQALQGLINSTDDIANNPIYSGRTASIENDIIILFGQPDMRIGTSTYLYNLKSGNNGCSAIIGISPSGLVSYWTIKYCN